MAKPQSLTSELRRHIASARRKRLRLEEDILRRRMMLDACLVERVALAGGKQRKTPAYYLSRKAEGKTKLIYVRKDELARVRKATEAWRAFSAGMTEWVKVTRELERLMRELGRAQTTADAHGEGVARQ